MRRFGVLAVAVAMASLLSSPAGAGASPGRRPAVTGGPATVGIETIASGLAFPAAFTFAPGGRIVYGERFTGEIRILDPSTGSDTLFFTVSNVETSGERGLLGLAVHPSYPAAPYLYVYATRNVGGSIRNQILRITDEGGLSDGCCQKVIFSSDTVSGSYHDGGRILFGPDGMLYAIVGDAHNSSNAQNLDNTPGKLHRMTPNGGVPNDNPFPGSSIFAYGIRNSYGFTFDPLTGLIWEKENGPSCNDEVNTLRKGRNYGWGPNQTCSTPPDPPVNTNQDGPNPQLPKAWFTPTIAPTGGAFCVGCSLTGSEGTLFFGAFNTGEIRRVKLTENRRNIQRMAVVYDHPSGILSLERGPDQELYFSTSAGLFKLIEA
jgi:glucose/arabinose dehydrogenase